MSGFDRIARPYRWLEYLTLGRTLERCRLHFLPELTGRISALVFGDGDGRFLARLLTQKPQLEADAVDSSPVMLALLKARCERNKHRLRTHNQDALTFLRRAADKQYDLVVTHFLLDCLSQPNVNTLASEIIPKLAPNALWLISDFRIPTGPLRIPAKALVRSLYFAFRILTGLRITQLPDHAAALHGAGFTLIAHHHSLAGLLTAEIWQLSE